MTTEPRYTECPICGAELQATRMVYLSEVVLNQEFEIEESEESLVEPDVSIYCDNDHSEGEMIEAWKKQGGKDAAT